MVVDFSYYIGFISEIAEANTPGGIFFRQQLLDGGKVGFVRECMWMISCVCMCVWVWVCTHVFMCVFDGAV